MGRVRVYSFVCGRAWVRSLRFVLFVGLRSESFFFRVGGFIYGGSVSALG